MKRPQPDLLDWTITHAPDTVEADLATLSAPVPAHIPPPPSHQAQASSRRVQWATLGAIAAIVLGLTLYTAWEHGRVQREVAHVIALEAQAAEDDDSEQLAGLVYDENIRLLRLLAEHGLAAPVPAVGLRPAPETKTRSRIVALSPDTVRAVVTRTYLTPDGQATAFTLDQFYRYADGAWKRAAAPEDYWGARQRRKGAYHTIEYYAVDAALIEKDIGPYLDDVLTRACAVWACPEGRDLTLDFVARVPISANLDAGPASHEGPLLFLLYEIDPASLSKYSSWLWPSPHAVGYPADRAATEWLKRTLALQALARMGQRVTRDAAYQDQSTNAFFPVLIARMGAHLGLESPDILADDAGRNPFGGNPFAGSTDDYQHDQYLRAQWVLNRLLKDQTAESEVRLLEGLSPTQGELTWLASGLNISEIELSQRLLTLAAGEVRILPAAHYEMALGCEGGPALFSRGDASLTYLLSGQLPDASISSWSPEGRWLTVTAGGLPMVIDLAAHTLAWWPELPEYQLPYVRSWVSASVAAYSVWPYYAGSLDSAPARLNFHDFADPARRLSALSGVVSYSLSPDKSTAAVTTDDAPPQLLLIPAMGGPSISLGAGGSPAWSPDSKTIIFAPRDAAGTEFTLRSVDVRDSVVSTRDILPVSDLGQTSRPESVWVVWSPRGDRVAFVVEVNWTSRSGQILGVMSPEAEDVTLLGRLQTTESYTAYGDVRFSADGQFLAATELSRSGPQSETLIFDAHTGEVVRRLEATNNFSWSPTGHQLAWLDFNEGPSLFLLTEPGDLHVMPARLIYADCRSVIWNPAP